MPTGASSFVAVSALLAVIPAAGDGSGRVFVVEQNGRIKVIDKGADTAGVFLDISDRVSKTGERGLLGLAFAPDYKTSGVFYLDYTDTAGDTVISRYRVSASSGVADPGSAQVLLTVKQPYANHNGGQIVFGPDGYLYIGMGDGGSGGDPKRNAQNGKSLLGKLLRIDVTGAIGTSDRYRIPLDNPFVADTAFQPEIWALGLRNPWRFSFDRGTGNSTSPTWVKTRGKRSTSSPRRRAAATTAGTSVRARTPTRPRPPGPTMPAGTRCRRSSTTTPSADP